MIFLRKGNVFYLTYKYLFSKNHIIMELYDIIELLQEAIQEKDWDLIVECKDRLEVVHDLNDGSLDKYFELED